VYSNLENNSWNGDGSSLPISTYYLFATTTGFGFPSGDNISINTSGVSYVGWTFAEQPKFFDIVTWSGDGSANRPIAHNLGAAPGAYFIKARSGINQWYVYHKDSGNGPTYINNSGVLNTANAFTGYPADGLLPDASNIYTVGFAPNPIYGTNNSGVTYIAYLFASDAGGFGAGAAQNAITCGAYVGNGVQTGPTVTLGYEPQWLFIKKATGSANWFIYDNARNTTNTWPTRLNPNVMDAENSNDSAQFLVTSTGFRSDSTNNSSNSSTNTSGATYVYVAIRKTM
jgi:hypothetical protein